MTIWKNLDSAIAFAATAHAGQIRKHTGLPYVLHPLAVMELVHGNAAIVTEEMLIASVLHDVVEDTEVAHVTIERRFGPTVAALVFDLTDQYVEPALGNRAKRKGLERARLAQISNDAATIKYADLIHNTQSIVEHDRGFAGVYLKEKQAILEVMTQGDAVLYDMACASLAAGQEQLLQDALK